MSPPLQPASVVSQLTSCCSERPVHELASFEFLIAIAPSSAPVVENDQHEPHEPWSLTGVTAPAETQSTSVAPLRRSALWSAPVFAGTL